MSDAKPPGITWSEWNRFEWRFRARQSLLLQYLRTNGLIDDFGPFADTSNEVTVGYKWELRRHPGDRVDREHRHLRQ